MKNFLKQNWFKIIAVIFLLGALGNWPYGYYQLLRWFVSVVGIYVVYLVYNNRKDFWAWIFGAIAILFNPIFPIYLSKSVWQPIDIIVAIIFFVSIFYKYERKIIQNNV
ncbi:hypothetical protein A3I34_02830 [Candidatus Jorgensenbacteria bacterium RIFCSPLOWO2_02_FULL_45_12]|uniref:Uncharacterized protein n=1 Tax=Candidatus Jorgensenbacteria bacterium RIFCSPHIGHO2_02_FULL_45_20 TaxID=1798470 RepID=A0A1F6BQC7_9BACT|nr:MAG: hypothetical protein A3D55_00220 [Candidatus Jorgensenbacteria bacterium RIFCSPHIGHO2_02_FULL_45_20]OGG42311.1 MAG: hypothetical protein A3I34_02830 [Candidatus Jorgensenbacteria bacterium RIFCSPLOWO2_02_FULL_45_12]